MDRESLSFFRESLGLPKLELPPALPPTPEELERRKKVFDRMIKLQEEIGPIDMTLEDLMAYDEDEDEREAFDEKMEEPNMDRESLSLFRESLGLPKLELPPALPPTPEELERRKKVFDRMIKLQEEIGPIDMTLEDLMAYDEDDG